MPSNATYACVACRIAHKGAMLPCTRCGAPMTYMGKKWRAPRRTNLRAWKRIASGEIWWESDYASARYVRVVQTLGRRTYNSLRLAATRGRGSALDSPETVREPERRRKR